MKTCRPVVLGWVLVLSVLAAACATRTYQPGAAGSPLHRLQLGQSYGDMVAALGEPDQSHSGDRSGAELAAVLVPGLGLVEMAGDFNPESIQTYTYHRCGTVTIANGKIIRVEAQP